MFLKKQRHIKETTVIWYNDGACNRSYDLGDIPIKEEVIIQKSIDFFSDPDPCYIHRGAVVVRLNEEVIMAIKDCPKEKVEATDIEESILNSIALEHITALKIEYQER